MKIHHLLIGLISLTTFAVTSHASGPVGHSKQAITHSSQAVGHSATAGVKTVAALTAVPLLAVGTLGELAQGVGDVLIDAATSPLEISDAAFSALPSPGEALKQQ